MEKELKKLLEEFEYGIHFVIIEKSKPLTMNGESLSDILSCEIQDRIVFY